MNTTLNAIGGFILVGIIVASIDLAAAARGLSDFWLVAITISVASACFTLRGIAKQ